MEKLQAKSAFKFARSASISSASSSSSTRGALAKSASWSSNSSRGTGKDQVIKQGFYEGKTKSKACTKESTSRKPQEIKLHTQQRAIKRAIFNYEVATKLYIIEQQRKQQEMIQKLVEEEEIRLLRKEMVPRAQLMPFFDKPFFPQRSNRPLTIPREPSLGIMTRKCSPCIVPGVNSTNRFVKL
ncbi:hypothetical protein UlMin_023942 [Ulmus minor]